MVSNLLYCLTLSLFVRLLDGRHTQATDVRPPSQTDACSGVECRILAAAENSTGKVVNRETSPRESSAVHEDRSCLAGKGFDIPGNDIANLTTAGIDACCRACFAREGCRAWVYKETTQECQLKSKTVNETKVVDCRDCYVYDPEGSLHAYFEGMARHTELFGQEAIGTLETANSTKKIINVTDVAHKQKSTEAVRVVSSHTVGEVYMTETQAAQRCTILLGYGQPEENTIFEVRVDHPHECCNACSMMEERCRSWVYRMESHMCQLKSRHVKPTENQTCHDCITYQPGETKYVYQQSIETDIETYNVTWSAWNVSTWETESFGERGAWKMSIGEDNEECTFTAGFDQPKAYDLGQPINVTAAYKCCDACKENKACRSWVWKARTHLCYLKDRYDPIRTIIPCSDCVAYSPEADYVLYSVKSDEPEYDIEDWASWPMKEVFMIQDIASKKCTYVTGYDQPTEYNLGEAIKKEYPYECCNDCAKKEGCKSWVFNTKTKLCQLKNTYAPTENIRPCFDCIMYDDSSSRYIYQAYSETVVTNWPSDFALHFLESMFGHGGSWNKATGCAEDTCTFVAGFAQPKDFNLASLYGVVAAYQCCDACQAHSGCKSWTWMRSAHRCDLKTSYDPKKFEHCNDCVSFKIDGEYVLYAAEKNIQRTAYVQKYQLDDWRSWPTSHGVFMIEDIAQVKCKVTTGFDQPSKFNLGRPIRLRYSYECCNECAKRMPNCKAWVYHQDTKDCQLKMDYDKSENIPCPMCWMYDPEGETYVYQECSSQETTCTAVL